MPGPVLVRLPLPVIRPPTTSVPASTVTLRSPFRVTCPAPRFKLPLPMNSMSAIPVLPGGVEDDGVAAGVVQSQSVTAVSKVTVFVPKAGPFRREHGRVDRRRPGIGADARSE